MLKQGSVSERRLDLSPCQVLTNILSFPPKSCRKSALQTLQQNRCVSCVNQISVEVKGKQGESSNEELFQYEIP